QVQGWEGMMIYVFFPWLYRYETTLSEKKNPLERVLISKEHMLLWYDKVLLPSIWLATRIRDPDGNLVPNTNLLQHIPQSYEAAKGLTHAPAEAVYCNPRSAEVERNHLYNPSETVQLSNEDDFHLR